MVRLQSAEMTFLNPAMSGVPFGSVLISHLKFVISFYRLTPLGRKSREKELESGNPFLIEEANFSLY